MDDLTFENLKEIIEKFPPPPPKMICLGRVGDDFIFADEARVRPSFNTRLEPSLQDSFNFIRQTIPFEVGPIFLPAEEFLVFESEREWVERMQSDLLRKRTLHIIERESCISPLRALYIAAGQPYGKNRKSMKRFFRDVKKRNRRCLVS